MSGASENVQPTAAVPLKKKAPPWLKVGAPVLAAVVAIGAFFGVRAIFDSVGGQSKQAQIEAAVEQALAQYDPPRQLDEVTIITDVTAEPGAIRYSYSLVDVDPALVTAEVLEGIVGPGLCAQAATRGMLDQDIAMRYTYLLESTGDTYDLEFTKEYC